MNSNGMVNVKFTLSYDGTDFSGWQLQPNQRTVQGCVEDALGRMLESKIRVKVAGRTDSGVHAIGQVINFLVPASFPMERLTDAANSYFPQDIRVLEASVAPPSFDSRRSALARGYHYYLLVGGSRLPHLRRYCYHLRKSLDVSYLNTLASYLLGEHNFEVFSAVGDKSNSKIRKVLAASFFPSGPYLVFRIIATSFLWKMVRIILGTLLEYADKGIPAIEVRNTLETNDRNNLGQTAPARGLFLERVWYTSEPDSLGMYRAW